MVGPLMRCFWSLLLFLCAAVPAEGASRYAVRYANGDWGEGNRLHDWHEHSARPGLDGRPLLEPGNPFRWLIDRSRRPEGLPEAFVELIGGDRLPGTVVAYESGTSGDRQAETYFVVGVGGVLRQPEQSPEPRVRVLSRFVKRLVWRREREEYEPGTAFFLNGRRLPFRSLRLEPGGAQFLTAEGPQRCLYSELAELHLPAADPWGGYLEELAVLLPGITEEQPGHLLQLETTRGLLVTATTERMAVGVQGNQADSSRWIHALQPAWSLDLLWVPCDEVWIRRYFPADRPPLSRWRPTAAVHRALTGGGNRPPQRDRNTRGEPLVSGGRPFGWGFGAHAPTRLEFALPPAAIGLRTHVGIDRSSGSGGCVQAQVMWFDAPQPLWRSDFLLGGKEPADTGEIVWKNDDQPRRLVLELLAAHEGRPAGADPFDIRDAAGWLDPELRLDAQQLAEQVRERAITRVAAWRDWQVQPLEGGELAWEMIRPSDPSLDGFRLGVIALERPFRLTRTLAVGVDDQWLLISAEQPGAGGAAVKLTARIGEAPPEELEIPRRSLDKDGPAPLAVSLKPYQGTEITVHLEQHPTGRDSPVAWHSIRAVSQLPMLFTLFEEEGVFQPLDGQPEAAAALHEEDRHHGVRSLRLEPDGRFQLELPEPISIRQDPRYGEYRYLRFAFRKFGRGRACLELGHREDVERPARYDAGMGEPSYGKAVRVWALELPAEWVVMTRDLYTDFGEMEVDRLTLSGLGGEHVLFDHIHLARTQNDFELIPAVSPEVANRQARRELARELRDRTLPACLSVKIEGRWGSGVLVSPEGEVLTAGHVAVRPGQAVDALLADGRRLSGKSLGVCRTHNLALLRLERGDDAPLPHVAPAEGEFAELGLHLAVSYPPDPQPGVEPLAHIVGFRQVFRELLWTDFDPPAAAAGGPLFNEGGRLLGLHARRSSHGGYLYSRLDTGAAALLDRLRGGEVWGEWPAGAGPTIGVEITTVREGARVTNVFPGTPAERLGIRPGDLLTRVDGAPVVGLLDIYDALADRDPGQEVEVVYTREGRPSQLKLELTPRVP